MARRKKTATTEEPKAKAKTKKYAVLTAYNRADNLKKLIDSMREQRKSWKGITLIINVDVDAQGAHNVAVMEYLKEIDFVEKEIRLNKMNKGIKGNTFDVMAYAYDELGAESTLYLEDDFILSPDVLDLWDWYLKQDLKQVGVMSLFNRWGSHDKEKVHRSRAMTGWGFFSTAAQWEKYLKPAWINVDRMWDSSVARYIRSFEGVYNLFPDLSRTSNSGNNGVHVNDGIFNEIMKGQQYYQDKAKVAYQLTDEYKPDPSIHKD